MHPIVPVGSIRGDGEDELSTCVYSYVCVRAIPLGVYKTLYNKKRILYIIFLPTGAFSLSLDNEKIPCTCMLNAKERYTPECYE